MRYAIVAILVVMFATTPAILLAQTVEDPVTEKTDTVPMPAVAAEIEVERQLQEFRSEYLNYRADSITWGLTVVTILFAILGLVVAIVGFIGFQRLRHIETEARKHAEEIKKYKEQAKKDALAIREMNSEDIEDPDQAEEVKKAIESAQQSPEASVFDKAIAQVYSLQKAGKIEKAIEKSRAITNLAEGIDNEAAARAWFSVGYLVEELEEKVSAYSQAIRLDPSNPAAYSNRGIAKDDLKQHQAAIADYNEAIRIDPKYAQAYYNRGIAKVKLEQHQAAIADYNEAIRIDPKYAQAYYNRGISLLALKCMDEARSDLQTALRLAQETGNEELAATISNLIRKIDNPETQ